MRYLGRGKGLNEDINKRKDLRKTGGIYTSYPSSKLKDEAII